MYDRKRASWNRIKARAAEQWRGEMAEARERVMSDPVTGGIGWDWAHQQKVLEIGAQLQVQFCRDAMAVLEADGKHALEGWIQTAWLEGGASGRPLEDAARGYVLRGLLDLEAEGLRRIEQWDVREVRGLIKAFPAAAPIWMRSTNVPVRCETVDDEDTDDWAIAPAAG